MDFYYSQLAYGLTTARGYFSYLQLFLGKANGLRNIKWMGNYNIVDVFAYVCMWTKRVSRNLSYYL